jgi:hypothetical protein
MLSNPIRVENCSQNDVITVAMVAMTFQYGRHIIFYVFTIFEFTDGN